MNKKNETNSALPPIRVLDLTEGGCMLGGRVLGDLGADVIQIEPPGGSLSRIAPFYKDIPDPEKSLFWFAYNTNKRGITLDITTVAGQDIFKKLIRTTDVVIESYAPGYLDGLKLGYNYLTEIKPDIIMASISPFGQNGPKRDYQGSELTTLATGGFLYTCGNPDRAPTWISFPQLGFYAGAEAAVGSLTAFWHRLNTGEGQYLDVSMEECALSPTLSTLQMWDVNKIEFRRNGGDIYIPATGVRQPIYFQCKDGYVMILLQGGAETFTSSSRKLVLWMMEVGQAPEWLQKLDWKVDYNAATMGQEIADRAKSAIEKFTLTRTKSELYI
jgi:benzylsuccinate CoA-transferase BbsE subunit